MVMIDFSNIAEAKEGIYFLPSGKYAVVVQQVEENVTRNGVDFWQLSLKVVAGEYKDSIIKDALFFTEKALPRIKKIYSALGKKLDGKVDVKPPDILNKKLMVNITGEKEYYEKNGEQKAIWKNKVSFAGFYPASEYSLEEDKNLEYPYQYRKEKSLIENENSTDFNITSCDDVIGDEEIPF